MARLNQGSSLLMVICFTGAISLMVLGVWRATMFTFEACLARVAYAQVLKSTEGLLNGAIELGVENYEKLMQNTQEISLENPEWFAQQGVQYVGTMYFHAQKEYLLVRATIGNNGSVRCALRCHVVKNPQGGHRIMAWAIDTQT